MSRLPSYPAQDFLAFQLINPLPEPIRTGYIRRMLNRGGAVCGGLLEGKALAEPFLRKQGKEVTEFLAARALPPEDPARRLKMASEISDIRDVAKYLRTHVLPSSAAARPLNLPLEALLRNLEDALGFIRTEGVNRSNLAHAGNLVSGIMRAVSVCIRQPDVMLTLAELNTAANRRTVGVDDFEGWYATHFIVPRTATEVIAGFKPDKWQEVPPEDCPADTMLTQDILNAGKHGTLPSQRLVLAKPKPPESTPPEHERNPLAKKRRRFHYLLPTQWPGD